ncbi:helix-turn-helix domain-containing protein [Gordonia humi]|uniref:HTH iclR-type domain-containing protein n=1 Tax=Gordonia humi TaxID=686429 RepID=A0A840EUF9_9ACTN|nr:helix-turn-helix domain-containing protein [Gordonia humi]MBB4133933.1 hypothetical protein [Gordonia humi]
MIEGLERATRVLDLFSSDVPEWTVSDVCRELDLPKTTAMVKTVPFGTTVSLRGMRLSVDGAHRVPVECEAQARNTDRSRASPHTV